jgi:hypothetical protein
VQEASVTARADGGLRAIIRSHLGHLGQWVSIETGLTEQGVPDLNCGILRQQREIWIECKRTLAWAVKFRPEQVGWLFTRWRCGGNVFVFTRRMVNREGGIDELYVTDGMHARELSDGGLQAVPHLMVCAGGPGQWHWIKVEHVLRHFTSSGPGRRLVP